MTMNIVYLHTHDSGRYLQPYGQAVPTPELMNLARTATLFRQCYSAAPTCSPSRAALLTGTWPHVSGMLGLAHRGFSLCNPDHHLVRYLNTQQYETVLCGVQHEAGHAEDIGYQRILTDAKDKTSGLDQSSRDDETAARAAAYLKSRKNQPGRFFLSVGLFNTHRRFPADIGSVNPDYLCPPAGLYDCPENRQDTAGFLASAAIMDRCVGQVLAAIRAADLDDQTIVLFTTDHGIAFPYRKCQLYDTGIGVALMLRVPGNPTAGRAVDALISQVDVFPTLCDMCGLVKPDWLQGVSFLDILQGRQDQVRDELFAEVTYHAAYEPQRCVRTRRYKLIRRYDWHNGIVPANIDNGPSKQFLLDAGLLQTSVAREMLFDLYLDPLERENRVGDPAYQAVYADLSGHLARWMTQTDDPLAKVLHRVPAPTGAVVNTRACLQPEGSEYEAVPVD
jgi:arylsulfatase A-like enzyme